MDSCIASKIIEARDLCCVRSGRRVFSDLSFSLKRGAIVHLCGANGSGKTSLLRMIAGILPPASGRIAIGDMGDMGDDFCSEIHYIGHANALSPSMSVMGVMRFWARLMESARTDHMMEDILDVWRLREMASLPVGILSAGQARALALCRLSLEARALWLLDEPAAGLDEARCDILRKQMAEHIHQGGAIIFSGHAHENIARGERGKRGEKSENFLILDMDKF